MKTTKIFTHHFQTGGSMKTQDIKSFVFTIVMTLSVFCAAAAPASAIMDIDQTLSDGAQRNTIAFDGFGMITGTFEAQTFFPPGKVADYWGFQYLRDNTTNGNGHNTSFLTNCAYNILYTLSTEQFAALKTLATNQVEQINTYGYKRFPLMKAFRRQLEGDIPTGASGLSLDAVKVVSSDLYKLDGQICFDRAVLYAGIYRTLSTTQKSHLDAMKAGGFDSWTVSTEMEAAVKNLMRGVTQDVSVALMTYASDLFSWYAGSLDADVYFCPERQGTYYGSFYIKDAPAIGHEGYKIDEKLTADAGQYFLDQLATTNLDSLVTDLVDKQRNNLYAGAKNIVQVRTDISVLLRSLITASAPTDTFKAQLLAQVLEKSGTYGELDGEIVYLYTMAFAQVYPSITNVQKTNLVAMRKKIMSGVYDGAPFDYSVCTTPFLYSAAIKDLSVLDPYISNTDYLFDVSGAGVLSVSPSVRNVSKDAGATTFNVSNTGTGTMPWTAALTSGGGWLSITSGASGTDTGTINCSFTANTSTSPRTTTVRVTSTGATGSPVDVMVTQAGLSESLAVSFDSIGLWIYNSDSATWTQISTANSEDMIYSGSTLYVDFGASYGLYKWDGAAWTQITSVSPENMVTSGSTLYVNFGASYGLYKWDGPSWAQLTSVNPENMVTSGSTLYVDFGASYGLYKWDGAAWTQLTSVNPENMATSGSTLYVDFGASYGLYKWDGVSWAQLTSVNPENMETPSHL
jgi:hypothetical protein